ncbi:putative glutamine synthetase, type I [Besnoitia besnoiti]|uniref:Lengsin n=1 Tax=Besnoitia besnoiti TaxID=94643 RepID=A0A2A9MQB4_BESBE|nr:putative glutamine synthetase, type I [Besnoitia besnoiti]PFH38387.1 putative glutamine synthetase, type I [Besnoitia besnoiti]
MSLATPFNSASEMLEYLKANEVQLLDCCFVDPGGLWHHCSMHVSQVDEKALREGFAFDGSSIRLFATVACSDMSMIPDPKTCWIDPFQDHKVMHVTCAISDPNGVPLERCPRRIAQRCEDWVKSLGLADAVYIGPEAEFFILDDVRYSCKPNKISYELDCAEEGAWNTDVPSKAASGTGNLGHRMPHKKWYFPVAPIDKHANLRTEMLLMMGELGLPIEKHHHEVGCCQHELGFTFRTLVDAADAMMVYKYVVKNVAQKAGKTATFMPKPMTGDCGSGMHSHQSLWKNGTNLFFDEKGSYMKLSQVALWYIGGLLKHAHAVLAFTNASTNSYKRLVPGYEAPTKLTYSKGNRSAAVRIPLCDSDNPKAKRLEFRCPDAAGCPYLGFAAMVMAGIDGVRKQIAPPPPAECDAAEIDPSLVQSTPSSLSQVLDALEADHDFLLEGGVFTKDFIHSYIEMKRAEVAAVELTPHPREFELYYHC